MFRYDCLMWFVKHCLLKIKSLVSGIWILVQVGVGPDVLTACTVVNLIFDSEDDYCKLLVVEIAVVIFYLFMTRLLGSHLFFSFFFCIKILIQLTWYHSTDMIQLTFTLKMTTTQVVETSVTVNNNSPIQDYIHPDDHPQPPYKMTFRFKPFPALKFSVSWNMHTLQLLWNLSLTDKHFLEKKKMCTISLSSRYKLKNINHNQKMPAARYLWPWCQLTYHNSNAPNQCWYSSHVHKVQEALVADTLFCQLYCQQESCLLFLQQGHQTSPVSKIKKEQQQIRIILCACLFSVLCISHL